MKNIDEIKKALEQKKCRSAWAQGVVAYALELLGNFEELTEYAKKHGEKLPALNEKALLNGAGNWRDYSWGGSSLIYNCDIARRLCTPSELKRTDDGNKRPNSFEDWLDVQTRALNQACRLICYCAN